ncbi:MAG TPA: hypothetical protein VJ872_10620 [Nocardioides sp.]|nr:hypothetical protein [Nocardioides sp.]
MPRALIKILVSLALALGLTLTVSPGNAHAATTPAACANQQAWVNSAQHALARAQRALRKTQHTQHQAHHAAKVRAAKVRVAKARATLADARAHRDTCVRDHQTSPTVTTASPVQSLCDAGVPQPICDALAGLTSSIPSGLSIADLCAQIPNAQALCDAIAGAASGGLDTSALQSVLTQVLNATGLGDLLTQLGLGDLLNLLDQLI